MILTPEQRGYAEMGMDVFTSNRQSASIKSGLWPSGLVVYDIEPALGKVLKNVQIRSIDRSINQSTNQPTNQSFVTDYGQETCTETCLLMTSLPAVIDPCDLDPKSKNFLAFLTIFSLK